MSNSITTSFIKPVTRINKGARMRKLGLNNKTSTTPTTEPYANQPFQLTDEYKSMVCSQSYLGKKDTLYRKQCYQKKMKNVYATNYL